MHIPALDSLRQERVGMITAKDGAVSMLTQAHVRTEDSAERGAYDPIEGMARPFPYMSNSQEATVIEPVIETGTLTPLSDRLIEYISLLYESIVNEEWVDELDNFDESDFSNTEARLASSLMHFAGRERPMTLWRAVYEKANRLHTHSEDDVELIDNPLRDIEGRERYQFAYLPSMDDVDEWTLTYSGADRELDDGTRVVSESLWLRYKRGDTEEERPIVVYQNEEAGFTAQSPSVNYGADEMDEADDSLVEAILSDESDHKSALADVSPEELRDTRTVEYLESY